MVEAWRSYNASKAETAPRATAGNSAVVGTELIEGALNLRARLRFGFGARRLCRRFQSGGRATALQSGLLLLVVTRRKLEVRADAGPLRLARSWEAACPSCAL